MMRVRSVYPLVILLPLFGCSSAPAIHVKSVPPSVPQGWTTAEDKADGISIAVPPGWKAGSGETVSLADVTSGMGGDMSNMPADPNNPLAKMVAGQEAENAAQEAEAMDRLRKNGVMINVFDAGTRPIVGETRPTFLVHRKQQGGNWTMEDVTADEEEFLKGKKGPGQKVTLPIGPAVRYDAEVTTRGGDKFFRISYVLVDGTNAYALRFKVTNNGDAIKNIAQQVAESLRITPSK